MRVRTRPSDPLTWTRYAINHKSWSCSGPAFHSSGSVVLKKEVIYDRLNRRVRGRYVDGPVLHKAWEIQPIDAKIARTGYSFEACEGAHAVDYYRGWGSPFSDLVSFVDGFSPPKSTLPNPSRSDIYDRISNPYGNNFFETAASFSGGLQSLAKSVGSKLALLKNLPKPKIPRNREELWKLRKLGGSALSQYLEWEFGWKQAGEDLARLLAYASSMRDHLDKLEREKGKPIRIGFANEDEYSIPFVRGRFRGVVSGTSVSRLVYRLTYSYPSSSLHSRIPALNKRINSLSRSLEFWGLSISAKRTWELVPGSWLIDQVLPISDFLSDFGQGEALFGDAAKIDFLGNTVSVKSEFTGYAEHEWAKMGGAYRNSTDRTRFTFSGRYYNRRQGFTPPPVFSIRSRDDFSVSNTGKAYLGILALNKLK